MSSMCCSELFNTLFGTRLQRVVLSVVTQLLHFLFCSFVKHESPAVFDRCTVEAAAAHTAAFLFVSMSWRTVCRLCRCGIHKVLRRAGLTSEKELEQVVNDNQRLERCLSLSRLEDVVCAGPAKGKFRPAGARLSRTPPVLCI